MPGVLRPDVEVATNLPVVQISITEDLNPGASGSSISSLRPTNVLPSKFSAPQPADPKLLGTNHSLQTRQRSPSRQATEDIELQERKKPITLRILGSPGIPRTPSPSRRTPNTDSILDATSWRGDVATFAAALVARPESRHAKIVKIQARKSRKLPFRHEFLLVYFVLGNKTRVARVDRLGKIGGILGLRRGHTTALEEVHLFDLEHEDAEHWIYDSKRNGSIPIATLRIQQHPVAPSGPASSSSSSAAQPSTTETNYPTLSLVDIARILSFIQVEMPTYVLTTKNCFMMTRSILMILCTCFGDGYFICYIGDESSPEGPVSAAFLVEPLYNGIVRWYFPVVLTMLVTYMLTMLVVHWFVEVQLTGYKDQLNCTGKDLSWDKCAEYLNSTDEPRGHDRGASKYGGVSFMHMLLDLPIPCAVIHWWLTKMEKEIKSVCIRLRRRIERTGVGGVDIFKDHLQQNTDATDPDGPKNAARPWLIALTLAVGGSVFLGVYWDKGLMVGLALFFMYLLVCAFQGDGISPDMESYVRLETSRSDSNV